MENKYPWQGMLIATILMIAGIMILFFTGAVEVSNLEEFYMYFNIHGFEIILSLFFVFIGIYCWYLYICNVLIKPKEKTMYLIEKNKFIDEKGKKYDFNSGEYEINKYYLVLKTKNEIKKIINYSYDCFEIPREKESYWLNCYLPVGSFENIFLLPIIYIIFVPFLLSFLMSNGWDKLFGFTLMIMPLYLIIYDLIYKIKKKKSYDENVDDISLKNTFLIFINVIKILIPLSVLVFMIYLFYINKDTTLRLFFLPFLLVSIINLGYTIAQISNNLELMKLFKKLGVIIFAIIWFSILGLSSYSSLKSQDYVSLIFIIPFFAVGLFIIYKHLIKNDM